MTAQQSDELRGRLRPLAPGRSLAALLSDEPRVAMVRVIEDLETYSLGKKDFREAVAPQCRLQRPDSADLFRQILRLAEQGKRADPIRDCSVRFLRDIFSQPA